MINKSTLAAIIQGCMNRWNFETPTVNDVTQLSLSSNALGEINTLVVTSVGTLPDLAVWTSPDSVLVFVQDLGVYAISSQLRWITLDGRLLRDDAPGPGQIWAWGANSTGQLGDATQTSRSSPVSIVEFTDWCQVSGGSAHSVAVRTGGSAWAWGQGGAGQLGNCDGSNTSVNVQVVGGFTDWCQVAGGSEFTSAVRSNKTAWAWGLNSVGQLGDGTTTNRSSPVSVLGGFSDWCQISAGGCHNVAVRTVGSAWAWGSNCYGRLGNNTTTTRSSPVSVVGGFTDWCQAIAGSAHSVAVRSSGSLWAWGLNSCGRLGDNTSTNRSSPVSVVGGFTDWCQASAGNQHSMAGRTNGSLWGTGYGLNGRIGNNLVTTISSPASVVGGFTDWCCVSAGGLHTVAVRLSGSAWAWGSNGQGQLGDNSSVATRSSPVSVAGGFNDWFQVSAGNQFSLGIRGPV